MCYPTTTTYVCNHEESSVYRCNDQPEEHTCADVLKHDIMLVKEENKYCSSCKNLNKSPQALADERAAFRGETLGPPLSSQAMQDPNTVNAGGKYSSKRKNRKAKKGKKLVFTFGTEDLGPKELSDKFHALELQQAMEKSREANFNKHPSSREIRKRAGEIKITQDLQLQQAMLLRLKQSSREAVTYDNDDPGEGSSKTGQTPDIPEPPRTLSRAEETAKTKALAEELAVFQREQAVLYQSRINYLQPLGEASKSETLSTLRAGLEAKANWTVKRERFEMPPMEDLFDENVSEDDESLASVSALENDDNNGDFDHCNSKGDIECVKGKVKVVV